MESTNRSLTPALAIVLSVFMIAFLVFVYSQRGNEVDGGFGTPGYPAMDAPERLTEEDVTTGEVAADPPPLPTTDRLQQVGGVDTDTGNDDTVRGQ
ncbi:MAG: hypothetical protein AAGG50_09245 [Bacteroidota bacterium]